MLAPALPNRFASVGEGGRVRFTLLAAVASVLVSGLLTIQLGQLSISCSLPDSWLFPTYPLRVLLNLAILAVPLFLLVVLTGRIWASALITTCIITLLAVVNAYTVDLHSLPLCYTELRNATAAAAVLDGYDLSPGPRAWQVLGLAGANVLVALALRWVELRLAFDGKARLRLVAAACAVVGVMGVWALGFSAIAPVQLEGAVTWSRPDAARKLGYPAFLVADASIAANPLAMPETYDVAAVDAALSARTSATRDAATPEPTLPDIIVVLNESFYDLGDYTELRTDRDYLKRFYSIDGATYGHAVVPNEGGGTNDTEFELITSHSTRLLKVSAPFNFIDFTTCTDTNVSYLAALGYQTSAYHVGHSSNYARRVAYAALGFDRYLLGSGNFPQCNDYGNRPWNDSGIYARALERIDDAGDIPQFEFLLTFQNHGGWSQNGPSYDTVHALGSYSVEGDMLDEYLTTISQSGDEFADFIDDLRENGRDTVVVMMGDHCPSFTGKLPYRHDAMYPAELTSRSVPLVVWSNFGLDTSAFSGRAVTTTDIIPLIAEALGLPESPYYQTITRLSHEYPVRTQMGTYVDAAGSCGSIDENPQVAELAATYYTMGYNALSHGADYHPGWFSAPTSL